MVLEKTGKKVGKLFFHVNSFVQNQNFVFWDWFIFLQLMALFIFLTFYFEVFTFHKETVVYTVFTCLISLQLLIKKKLYFLKRFSIPIVIFLTGVIVTTVYSQVPELSVFKLLFYTANMITFINAYSLTKKNTGNMSFYIVGLFLVGFIVTACTFTKTFFPEGDIKIHRAFIGPFYWHNQMAGFLLFFTPSIFLISKLLRNRILKIIVLIFSIFMSIALFLTYSRGGILIFISLFLSMFFIFYTFESRANKIISRKLKFFKLSLRVLALIGIVTTLVFTHPRFHKKATDLLTDIFKSNKTTSGNLRIETYKSAFQIFKDYPLTGVGLGAFGEAMYHYERQPWLYAKFTHNHFLQTFSEGGLITGIGLIFVIYYIYTSFTENIKNKGNPKSDNDTNRIFSLILLISITGSILHNFIDVDWNYPALSFLFWFFAGLLMGNLNFLKDKNIHLNNSLSRFSITSILLFFVFVSVILGHYDRELGGGQIALENQDYSTAEKHFENAIKILPFSYRSFWGLGYVNIEQEEKENAISNFLKASQHNPYSAEPLFRKYVIEKINSYLSPEQKEEAILEVINLNKFAQPVYYTEAYKVFKENDKEEEALNILRIGSEERFHINQSYNDFIYIYQNQPQFTGELFDLHLNYALELKAYGEDDKSKEVVQKALEIYKNDDTFQNILKTLTDSEK